jgi:hypothetical protein
VINSDVAPASHDALPRAVSKNLIFWMGLIYLCSKMGNDSIWVFVSAYG